MSTGRPKSIPIDPQRHLETTRVMKALRERSRVVVSSRHFGDGGMTARVLIDREYYDVDARQLAKLQAGRTPDDLDLHPVEAD